MNLFKRKLTSKDAVPPYGIVPYNSYKIEAVTISLDRYNRYLFYKKIVEDNRLIERLADILNEETFDLSRPIDRKLFELYEDILRKEADYDNL